MMRDPLGGDYLPQTGEYDEHDEWIRRGAAEIERLRGEMDSEVREFERIGSICMDQEEEIQRLRGENGRMADQRQVTLMALALRQASVAAVSDAEGIPWDDDHDRATVAVWLMERADTLEAQ